MSPLQMRELEYRKIKNNMPKVTVNNLLRLDVKKNMVSKPVLLEISDVWYLLVPHL